MHLKAQRPVFVPKEFFAEVDELTKAALMDMVWDYATRCNPENVVGEFRATRAIILNYRKQAKAEKADVAPAAIEAAS